MAASFNLPLDLPPRGSRRLRQALRDQLKAAIETGRLAPGARLPSTRELAAAFGVSRNTMVVVFDHLSNDGYLRMRRGAGAFVSERVPATRRGPAPRQAGAEAHLNPFWRAPPQIPPQFLLTPVEFDFRLGITDMYPFPFDVWRRILARSVRRHSKSRPSYSKAQGREGLRQAIVAHVSATRAVACDKDDVVVTAGAQQAYDLLAKILVTHGRTMVAVENPGYPLMRVPFAAAGALVRPVPVDEEGMVVRRIPAGAKVICVTPSHQFPFGPTMSMRRRKELLEYAHAHRAVIIEDDYDGEFYFGKQPFDALQTLDKHGSVIYVGTFTKTLFPGIRMGFLVAPPWALQALVAAKRYADWQCSTVEQETLTAFITEGHLGRHIRRAQRIYATRRSALLAGIKRHFSGSLEVIPSMAGLHITVLLKSWMDLDKLVKTARGQEIGIYNLREFYMADEGRPGLIFGYGAIDERRIVEGLARLNKLWR